MGLSEFQHPVYVYLICAPASGEGGAISQLHDQNGQQNFERLWAENSGMNHLSGAQDGGSTRMQREGQKVQELMKRQEIEKPARHRCVLMRQK